MIRWRALLLAAVVASVAGCGGYGVGSEGPPTPAQARAQASARFAGLLNAGAPALQVALERDETSTIALREVSRGGVDSYVSSDGVALKLRRGMLVGTAGLGADMTGSNVADSLALVTTGRSGVAERFHSFLDGENRAVTRSYVCIITPKGGRGIQVGTRDGQLRQVTARLVQEDCKSLDQEFSNLYWLASGSGRIVQSRQWAGDFTGPIVLRAVLD